jgi:hypothetical protein
MSDLGDKGYVSEKCANRYTRAYIKAAKERRADLKVEFENEKCNGSISEENLGVFFGLNPYDNNSSIFDRSSHAHKCRDIHSEYSHLNTYNGYRSFHGAFQPDTSKPAASTPDGQVAAETVGGSGTGTEGK